MIARAIRTFAVGLLAVNLTILAGQLPAQEAKGKDQPKSKKAARKPSKPGQSSTFYCPKCAATEGAKLTLAKGGKCKECETKMVKGRKLWYCNDCKKLNYRSAKCTKCKENSQPVLAHWVCEEDKWTSAAKRKQCPKCKKAPKEIRVANLTVFECAKCLNASAQEDKCPSCEGGLTKITSPAAKPKEK